MHIDKSKIEEAIRGLREERKAVFDELKERLVEVKIKQIKDSI